MCELVAAVALAGVLGAAVLAGCSSSGSSGAPAGSTSSGGVINLSFWNGLTGPDKLTVDHVIAAFNASHPGIHVTSDPIPWDVLYTKLLPAFGAGKGPDLVGISSDNLPNMQARSVLQPLDSIFSMGVDKASIIPSELTAGEYQGKLYGVPIETHSGDALLQQDDVQGGGYRKPAGRTGPQWAADAQKLDDSRRHRRQPRSSTE